VKSKGFVPIAILLIAFFVIGIGTLAFVPSDSLHKQTVTPQPTVINQTASSTPTIQPTIIPTSTSNISNKTKAKVVKVVDGDTMDFSFDGKTERVRVIGINTPETVDPRKSVECFGQEASNQAKKILTIGLSVELEKDSSQGERDKYNRLLRYVFVDNGTIDFGMSMIGSGYAYEYTYDTPYKYQSVYKQAQKEAEGGKKGLWADNACVVTVTPTATPISNNSGGSWSCDCSKTCTNISSCQEAQYLLNTCGCSTRDGDKDGIACDGAPLNCQN
jgi:micrococcal nuclease